MAPLKRWTTFYEYKKDTWNIHEIYKEYTYVPRHVRDLFMEHFLLHVNYRSRVDSWLCHGNALSMQSVVFVGRMLVSWFYVVSNIRAW